MKKPEQNMLDKNYSHTDLNLGGTNMEVKLPRFDKTALSVSSLHDETEELNYWFNKSPSERMEAIEINRRMVYGKDRTSSRLQRFFEVSELSKS